MLAKTLIHSNLLRVRKLEAQIKGCRNTRAEENQLLKQLKDLGEIERTKFEH